MMPLGPGFSSPQSSVLSPQSFDLAFRRTFKRAERSLADGLADLSHPVHVEVDVVERKEHWCGKILHDEEVSDVGASVALADRASATGVQRREVFLEPLVLDRHLAFA